MRFNFSLKGLGATCPEGSRLVNDSCQCYSGRVWMPDGSKCVSPQAPSYSGAISLQQYNEQGSQQELTAAAEQYIENAGHTIDCMIDWDNWDASPAGGEPMRVCSIDGGEYIHGASVINLNPYNALVSSGNAASVANLVNQFGGSLAANNIPTGQQDYAYNDAPAGALGFEEVFEDAQDFLSDSLVGSIPNWVLLAGVGAGAVYFVSKR